MSRSARSAIEFAAILAVLILTLGLVGRSDREAEGSRTSPAREPSPRKAITPPESDRPYTTTTAPEMDAQDPN